MTYFCDWGPYFKSQTGNKFRVFPAATAADWTGVSLRSDDTRTLGALAAGATALWLAQDALTIVEALAELVLIPGQYESTAIDVQIYRARVNTSTGQLIISRAGVDVVTVALPASVWTNSATFGSCWLRLRWEVGKLEAQARVWSVNEPEPVAWTAIHAGTSFVTNVITPQIGWPSSTQQQAFGWYSVTSNLGACPTPRRANDRNYFNKWLATAHKQGGVNAPRVMTLEVFAPSVQTGGPGLLRAPGVMRAATQNYDSGGAWPFDNQRFPAILQGWPTFERKLPESIVGRQVIAVGPVKIANANGANDRWIRAHNIRAVAQMRYGDPAWPFYDLGVVITGEVTSVSDDGGGAITLQMRDGMSRFDRLLQQTLTTGNDGRPIPRCLGECYNVSPMLIDPATLTYAIDSQAIESVTAVRDRGVTLTTLTVGVIESFNAAADTLRFQAAHNLTANSPFTPTGTLPSPLVSGTQYFVKSVVDAFQITVSATAGGATIDLTGSDTIAVNVTFPAANRIRTASAHSLTAGASFRLAGTMPGGATAGTQYFALAAGLTTTDVSFATAPSGAAVDLTSSLGYAAISASSASDFIQLASTHAFTLDEALVVEGATLPTPITEGAYFRGTASFVDSVKLRSTAGGTDIDITSTAISGATVSRNQSGYTMTRWLGATVVKPAYVVNSSAGTLQLLSNPVGQITADVQGERVGATYSASAAHAVRVLLGDNSGVHDAFRTGAQWSLAIGLAVTDRANLGDLLDQLAEATLSVWGVNRLGVFVARDIYAFSTQSINVERDALGSPKVLTKRLPANADQSLPVWRKNYTVQSPTDLASGLSAADIALWGKDFLQEGAVALPGLAVDNGTQGERLDVRRRTSIGVSSGGNFDFPERQTLDVQITLPLLALDAYELGRVVQLVTTRDAFNDSGTGQTMVTGIAEDFGNGRVTLTLLRPIAGFFP